MSFTTTEMSCYCLSLNDYNIVYPEGNSQNFQLLIYATKEKEILLKTVHWVSIMWQQTQ